MEENLISDIKRACFILGLSTLISFSVALAATSSDKLCSSIFITNLVSSVAPSIISTKSELLTHIEYNRRLGWGTDLPVKFEFNNLIGRLIKVKKGQVRSLTNLEQVLSIRLDPNVDRKLVFASDKKGVEQIVSNFSSVFDRIGYSNQNIVDSSKEDLFYLFAWPSAQAKSYPATWEDLPQVIAQNYEGSKKVFIKTILSEFVNTKENTQITTLKWAEEAGFNFFETSRDDPRAKDFEVEKLIEKYKSGTLSDWEVRAFLYFLYDLNDEFTGDGLTTYEGVSMGKEILLFNQTIGEYLDHNLWTDFLIVRINDLADFILRNRQSQESG